MNLKSERKKINAQEKTPLLHGGANRSKGE